METERFIKFRPAEIILLLTLLRTEKQRLELLPPPGQDPRLGLVAELIEKLA